MTTEAHTFTMTERQAELVHSVIASHTQALKNWTASAVERRDMGRAVELVKELREYEALFAAFNMQAKRDIAEGRGVPIEQNHIVRR